MKIVKKRLNNNAILAIATDGSDLILTGKGIGFNAKHGDEVKENSIEKIFKLAEPITQSKLIKVVTNIPYDYLRFTNQIIDFLSEKLQVSFDDNVYIILTDHIYFTVSRFKTESNAMDTSLLWEVKNIYPKEYEAAYEVLDKINKHFKVKLPVEEARMLTLHIVDNTQDDERIKDSGIEVKVITDVLNIVKYFFNIEYDYESLNYIRFLIHLKFLVRRKLNSEEQTTNENIAFLYDELSKRMPQAFKCTGKITEYFKKNRHFELSKNEQVYLTIHIQRIILNNEKV